MLVAMSDLGQRLKLAIRRVPSQPLEIFLYRAQFLDIKEQLSSL